MTFEEAQQLDLLVFNQKEEHGWLSADGAWSICSYHTHAGRFFQIFRRAEQRRTVDPRWNSVQAGIDTIETAAAIANDLARAELEALKAAI